MTAKKTTPRRATSTPEPTPKTETVTLQGRISTTALRAGDTVTVTRTPQTDELVAGGWATIVED